MSEGTAKGEMIEDENGVRNKSKKCSLFETISENAIKDNQESVVDTKVYDEETAVRKRKKSSKKVSIAENLNCDYSDTNISDGDEEIPLAIKDIFEVKNDNEPRDKNKTYSDIYLGKISNCLLCIIFIFITLVLYIVKHPVILSVISFLLYLVFFNNL